VISGCSLLQEIQKPEIVSVRPGITGIDFDAISLAFDVDVNNPYPIPIRAPRFRYGLDIKENEFFKGEVESGIDLPAAKVGTLTLPVQLSYKDLWRTFQGLSDAKEVDYTLNGALMFSALGKSFDLPLSHRGKFPVLRPPTFSNIKASLSEVSLTRAKIAVDADVKNPNVFDLGIKGLGYALKVGDEEIGGLDDYAFRVYSDTLRASKIQIITLIFSHCTSKHQSTAICVIQYLDLFGVNKLS